MTLWPALAFVLAGAAVAAPFMGQKFPHLEGEYLSGEKAELPEDLRGNVALLVVAFSDGALANARKWQSAFDERAAGATGVVSREVFLLNPVNRLNRTITVTKLRHVMPKREERNAIAVFAPVEEWKRRVGYSAANGAYAVLLDAGGTVRGVYSATGPAERDAQVGQAVKAARALVSPARKASRGGL